MSWALIAKISDSNFHLVEIVSRYRSPHFKLVKIIHIGLICGKLFENLDVSILILFLKTVIFY